MPAAPGPTITLPRGDTGGATATRAVRTASGYDEELRQLLRSRLLLFQLLTLAYAALLLALSAVQPLDAGPSPDPAGASPAVVVLLVGMLAFPLLGTVVIWWSPGMSLRSLRLWELFQFGIQAALNGAFRLGALASLTPELPSVAFGFQGAISLFGVITLILSYGVMIPNTPRRSLTVVAGLTIVPFVALAAAVAVNPALRWAHFWALLFQAAANLLIPAAVAVFAASRADALRRRAFEAERRANELGQYALKSKLGEGGMGEVWLAEHRFLKRPCAVKFVRPELAANPSTAARFEREVRAVTGLTHFNTVRVYDYGRADDGSFYYVMEYLSGPTLESLVKRAGPLDPARVVYLVRQLCGALAEAHAAGLVHRDVKPSNVIVTGLGGQYDVAKLLDFGLVQDLSAEAAPLTGAGLVIGTPAYMCPEQAGGTPADRRGDLYSLGAVAFFALTGRQPFECDTVGRYLSAHLTQTPPRADEVQPGVPGDLAAVVAKCLEKNPADRFQTAAELDESLGRCGCAGGWCASRAAGWWAEASGCGSVPAAPTRTFDGAEVSR